MANILIVHAHPEPKSFSSSLAATARDTFEKAGHTVVLSDLYALGFDAVSSRANYITVADPTYFKPQKEEQHAAEHGGFAPRLESELRKLEAADLLVFSFPLWWFAMPAILKGWVDRVFAYGRLYGRGRWYDSGTRLGKHAFVLITTGSGPELYADNGLHTPLESVLAPLYHGVFWFNGFSTHAPFVSWSPAHIGQGEREKELARLRTRLEGFWEEKTMEPPSTAPFVEQEVLPKLGRYLVSARLGQGETPPNLSDEDIAALKNLRRERLLLRAAVPSPEENEAWQLALELGARTGEDALKHARRIPLLAARPLDCVRLDSALAERISPFW